MRIFGAEASLSMSKPVQAVGHCDEKLWVATYSLQKITKKEGVGNILQVLHKVTGRISTEATIH